jgi:hypothetical protein
MINKKNKTQEDVVIAVKSRDHAKSNGVIPKDLMSRINNLKFVKRWQGGVLGVCAGLLMVMLFHACIKKAECKWQVASTKQITFDLMDAKIGYEFEIRTYESEGKSIEYATQKANEKVFQFFKNYCTSKGLASDDKTMALVVYYDLHISQSLSITDEHIKGISVYKLEGNNIMHHLYVKDAESNFSEIENVKVPVPSVTLNHISFYLENYVFTDFQNASSIVLWGDFGVETHKNIRKYQRTPIKFEVKAHKIQTGGGMTGCYGCYGSDQGSCQTGPTGGSWYCESVIVLCVAEDISGLKITQWMQVCNVPLMYSFRDNVLSNSAKGQEYIDNYYYLGGEWKGKISIVLGTQTASVLVNFNSAMEAFLDTDADMDKVVFTPTLSTSLLNLLDSYQNITTSAKGREILNSIRSDINVLRNKTLGEILVMLDEIPDDPTVD